ncbi:MAG: protein-methionine-sulfoxide reductase heme-binding subunit MsrQ [Longimicrobiales bacterium]
MTSGTGLLLLRIVMWASCLAPAAWLGAGAYFGWLGVNPIEKLTHVTGMTALVMLLVTLAVSPARRLTGWNPLIKIRRPLGLFAFFYAFLHFSVWMVLDLGFRLEWVWEDILERPYITIGFSALVLLTPLAITSTRGWIRRLGKKWTVLHRLAYLATALGLVHYYWLVKADVRLPLLLVAAFVVLMAFRVHRWWQKRAQARSRAPRTASAGAD